MDEVLCSKFIIEVCYMERNRAAKSGSITAEWARDISAVKYLFELIEESPAKSLEIANRVSRFIVVVRDG